MIALQWGLKVPDVPHKASVNSIVIGNVRPTKAEGVIVTGMLRGGAWRFPTTRTIGQWTRILK